MRLLRREKSQPTLLTQIQVSIWLSGYERLVNLPIAKEPELFSRLGCGCVRHFEYSVVCLSGVYKTPEPWRLVVPLYSY